MRAAVYLRASTEEKQEGSIPLQRRDCLAFIEKKGWELVEVWEDEHTGLDLDREGYRAMIRARDLWDVVVVRSRERLHRDLDNARRFIRRIVEEDKDAWSVHEGLLTSKKSAGEWFAELVMQGLGEFESRQISDRTVPGMAFAKEEGRHVGRPPAGFRVTREGGLEPTPWAMALKRDEEEVGALEAAIRNPYPRGKREGDPPSRRAVLRVLQNLEAWEAGLLVPNRERTDPGTHSRFSQERARAR